MDLKHQAESFYDDINVQNQSVKAAAYVLDEGVELNRSIAQSRIYDEVKYVVEMPISTETNIAYTAAVNHSAL